LPSCFRAVGGHFVTPEGEISPEIDIMLVDSRYPYPSQNENGSVASMIYSFLSIIEVKLKLKKKKLIRSEMHQQLLRGSVTKFFPEEIIGVGSWNMGLHTDQLSR
jgi:hypothetical protein